MQRKIWLLSALLLTGSAAYGGKGLSLFFGPGGGVDLHLRWQEQRYVMHGQNPYDITYQALRVGRPPDNPQRDMRIREEVGVPDSGGYPPWAFFIGYAMFWPTWPAVKLYFLAITLLMLALLAVWGWRTLRPLGLGPEAGWLGAASILAINGNSTLLHVGQYGAVVVGLLALALMALQQRRDLAAGVLLALALLKPNIAGPFFLVLLVTGRWRAIAACLATIAAACGFIWWQTSTMPLEMFLQSLSVTEHFVEDSQGLVPVLVTLGLAQRHATLVLSVSVGLAGLAVLYWQRHRSWLELFAIAAVIGRVWAYHKTYDNLMMAFLVLALAQAALAQPTAARWAVFLLVGAVTWAPASLFVPSSLQVLQTVVWLIGLVALILFSAQSAGAGGSVAASVDASGDARARSS